MQKKPLKARYFPSSFLIIMLLMIGFVVASWIGAGVSEEITAVGILDVFPSVWRGFVSKAGIILFIFAIGGTLAILSKLKVINSGIQALVTKLGDKFWVLIPVFMLIFGLGGTTFGMWSETIAFFPILIPVFKKAGYGSFTAVMVVILGAGTGCLASTINPFATGAAVSAANGIDGVNVTMGSMQGTRWVSFLVFEVVAIAFVLWLATRYKKGVKNKFTSNKQAAKAEKSGKSQVKKHLAFLTRARVVEGFDEDYVEQRFVKNEKLEFTTKRKISLSLFVLAFLLMIVMYLPWTDWVTVYTIQEVQEGWDNSMFWFASTTSSGTGGTGFSKFGNWQMISIAGLFLLVAIIIFLVNLSEFKTEKGSSEQTFISCFLTGIQDVFGCCMLIAVAAGLGLILDTTGYGPLIAREASEGLESLLLFGIVVFLVSVVLSFFIPSTSGFAAAFIPVFAETAYLAFEPDMVATAVSIAILGFIFASGVVNLVSPTSAVLVAYNSYAGSSYLIWVKQMWQVVALYFVLSLVVITVVALLASSGNAVVWLGS